MPSDINPIGRLWKKSFMLTMSDVLKQYSNSFHSDFQAMIDANGDELRTKQYRSKVTENFKSDLKFINLR